jgi:hypothetical protein
MVLTALYIVMTAIGAIASILSCFVWFDGVHQVERRVVTMLTFIAFAMLLAGVVGLLNWW